MQNSCVKLVTKDKVITNVLPVKAIERITMIGIKQQILY